MSSQRKTMFLTFSIILTCLIRYAMSLECFTCTSYENETCGVKFNRSETKVEPCCAACNACFKARVVTPENKTKVIRSCGTDYHCQLYDREGCRTCNKNLCNGSPRSATQSGFMIAVFICKFFKYNVF